MVKRVFIIHGWDGYPEEGWFPWLKQSLEQLGFAVFVPQLPQADNPRIEKWVTKVSEVVGQADASTYFIGHSMGCQTIARFLERLPNNVSVGGAVFVAGFFKRLTGLEHDPIVQETANHWLDTPIDLGKVRECLPKSVAIFSDDDPFVPLDNQEDFASKLDAKIIIEHSQGHFSGSSGTIKLPVVLQALLEISG